MLTKPKKSLGQNFLIDKNILKKIINIVPINKDNEICFIIKESNEKIPNYYRDLDSNLIFEYSLLTNNFLEQIFNYISTNGGLFLVFDYGPKLKGRYESIQCIHNKKKCDIF